MARGVVSGGRAAAPNSWVTGIARLSASNPTFTLERKERAAHSKATVARSGVVVAAKCDGIMHCFVGVAEGRQSEPRSTPHVMAH